MDHQRIKEAVNRKISEHPLFNDEDRKRFYESRRRKSLHWSPIFPKIMTAFLIFFLLTGSLYMYQDRFKDPATSHPDRIMEEPSAPIPEIDKEKTTIDKIEQIKSLVSDHPSKSKVDKLVEQLQGVEVQYNTSTEEEDGRTYESRDISYIFPVSTDSSLYDGPLPPEIDNFQNEEVEIAMDIEWVRENPDDSYILRNASLTYLSESGEELVEEMFTITAHPFEFRKVIGANEPVVMDDLVLQSIGRSLDKDPNSITKGDLLRLKNLTINASHLSGIYEVEEDREYFKAMQSLEVLKLNQAIIPGDLLKEVPYLDQATFIGPTLDDLSRVQEGLQTITYLNIINSSFRGNVEDILQLESLNIVRVDPAVVPNYEELQFEGIDVRW
ncbi:hypothetical protein SAMN04487936_1219 [Halobacillus dabanensis]|uniref:Uncharacterized protein n=1 Tax=Halobacillus dabanensis TaxID=240302 RepID=A0A1I4AV63_HALDA|nr:hypothetical protein [Halobacillus dabanensis]SFK59781.1 hypothetical protein SAMN04487936_1219 [Halobacillus dabanensis]